MEIKTAAQVFLSVLESKKSPKIKLLGDSITHGVGGSGWKQAAWSFSATHNDSKQFKNYIMEEKSWQMVY